MKAKPRRTGRRVDTLSKERIVAVAIEILDADGEAALTFRALAAQLETGSGAIYWHVSDKDDLLAAAADWVIAQAMATVDVGADPRGAIRAIALGVFEAIDVHPWVGAQLIREPWRPGTLRFFESIGAGVMALDVPEAAQFNAWSALVNYVLGVAGQNAANARSLPGETNRSAFLEGVASRWEQLDPAEYRFVRGLARQLRSHDDREQFLAGIDLILAGLTHGGRSDCVSNANKRSGR
jgi:AcrR family transcriptional regulator